MNTFTFSDLDDDLSSVQCTAPTEHSQKTQYPCVACRGTGQYLGHRSKQTETKCFTCAGRGHFLTSTQDRAKAKAGRDNRAQEKRIANMTSFMEGNPALGAYLNSVCEWNTFAKAMLQAVVKWGSLTAGQFAAVERMHDKHLAANVKREAPAVIDLGKIVELFSSVTGKRKSLRAGGITLSLAPSTGSNAGCIYAKCNDDYVGKITPLGQLRATRNAPADLAAQLQELAKDPKGRAIAHGIDTGNCSCCGRELTDPKSIERGIGPICADKWGF